MPPGHKLKRLPPGLGVSTPEFCYMTFELISKYLSDAIEKKKAWGLVALRSLLTLKKSTRNSDFQTNDSPPELIRPSLPYEVPLGK